MHDQELITIVGDENLIKKYRPLIFQRGDS